VGGQLELVLEKDTLDLGHSCYIAPGEQFNEQHLVSVHFLDFDSDEPEFDLDVPCRDHCYYFDCGHYDNPIEAESS